MPDAPLVTPPTSTPFGPDATFRQLAEALPHLVWSTTPDGYHDYFNERWYAYTGMPRPGEPGGEGEVAQGWNWSDYLHPDDQAPVAAAWRRALATGEPYEVEYRFREHATGRYRWFLGRAVPLHDAAGAIVRWFGTCTDIEVAKQAEARLAEQADVLRAQNGQLQTQAGHVQAQAVELAGQHATLARTNAELARTLAALETSEGEQRAAARRATLLQRAATVLADAGSAAAVAEQLLALAVETLGARHGTVALVIGPEAGAAAGEASPPPSDALGADASLGSPASGPPGLVATGLAATGEHASVPRLRILDTRALPDAVRGRFAEVPVDGRVPMTDAVHTGRPVYVPDRATLQARYPSVAALVGEIGVSAVAALPLVAEAARGPLGVLVLDFGEARPFDVGERRLLEAFAAQGAQALARALGAERLRAQEARFRVVQELSPDGFVLCDAVRDGAGAVVDFRYAYVNAAAERILGRRPGALLGRRMLALFPTARASGVFDIYRQVVETGEPYRGGFRYDGDGLALHFRVSAVRVGDGVAITFTDDTEPVRLQQELERERARLERIFEQAPAFIAVLRGPEHVFALANAAYQRLVGHRDLIGRPVLDALPEVRDQGFGPLLDEVRATGRPFVGTEVPVLLRRTGDGPLEQRHVTFVYQPLEEPDGAASGVFVHGVDVTDQVRARAEVEHARAEAELARQRAEDANRAKSEFLAIMSHELRTPLNAIGGYAELMALGVHGPVTEGQRDALARLQRAQRHLLRLITDVLNYARLEAGRVEYRLEPVPVVEAVRDVQQLVEPLVAASRLTLVVEPPPAPLAVLADREKLAQVLVNLLSNAVKFTAAGGTVTVDWLATGDDDAERVAIRVTDTGRGIPAEKLSSVFEPFVQVEGGRTRTAEGVGLGLAISRDLARGMGGDLTATSTVGEGSRFVIALPRVRADEEDRRTGDERREVEDRREHDDRRAAAHSSAHPSAR